jgi:hypothetical protein
MLDRVLVSLCLALGALLASASEGYTQQNIGSAALVNNDVSRELSGARGPVDRGDPLFRDELVRTGDKSTAKLIFLDSSNLAVGPISRVVLDRFVYDPSQPSSQELGVELATGLFRFTTGVLDKRAYSITTPTAAIGVRGTVLDISVQSDRTRVTLVHGRALVCPIEKGTAFQQQARDCAKPASRHCDCVELDNVGQTAQVTQTTTGVSHAFLVPMPVRFAALCAGAASLCSSETYASLGQLGPADSNGGATPGPLAGPAPTALFLPALGIVTIGIIASEQPVSP